MNFKARFERKANAPEVTDADIVGVVTLNQEQFAWFTKRNKSELFRKSKLVRICFLLLNLQIDAVSERGHATSLFSFVSASCCAFHSVNSLCPCSDSK